MTHFAWMTATGCVLTLFLIPLASGKNAKPLIVWWYDNIYPHIENGETVIDFNCGEVSCRASNDRKMTQIEDFQTIMFYGSDFAAYDVPLPRKSNQMWALLHEESPQNNFILTRPETLRLFNFSSTFKQVSDFPLTTQYIHSLEHLYDRKPVSIEEKNRYRQNGLAPVVYLQSHCDVPSDRDRYVEELRKFIKVDSYGECLHNKDFENKNLKNTSMMEDEQLYDELAKYKFHLTFENAICDDYVTEKLYRALHVGSVPIYMGAENVEDLSPERSVIRAANFKSPATVAKLLSLLDKNDDSYLKFLDYKKDRNSFPDKLRKILEERTWSAYDSEALHFVQEYECYICHEMHGIQDSRNAGQVLASRTVPPSHLDCPKPKPSLGDVNSLSKTDGFHKWSDDYSQSVLQALALQDVVANNETDPAKLWNYVSLHMDSGESPKHTEL